MLAPGAEVAERSDWSELAMEGAALYPDFTRELTAESGVPIDYRREGAVEIAADESEFLDMERRVIRQAELGIVSEECDPRQAAPGSTAPAGARARYFPADAIVDPRDVMRALRLACSRLGVVLREHTAVRKVEWRKGDACIVLGDATAVHADAAVIAAGAWSGDVVLQVDGQRVESPGSFPVRGHLLGYRLPPAALGPILRRGHTYLLQRSNGFFIAGASAERVGFDRRVDPREVAAVQSRAEALFAPLRGQTPEPWVGFRPATGRLSPELGFLPGTGIYLAFGHYRNGILMAPSSARRAAATLLSASSGTISSSR
jgi:glycine oxidase